MRITIVTIGTRGDVQPCIALARGLQAAGHSVLLATHAIYRDFVSGWGIPFHPMGGNPREVLEGEGGVSWLETGRNPVAMLTQLRQLAVPLVHELVQDSLDSCRDADMVLFSTLAFLPLVSIIEKLNLPSMGVYLQPIHPTRDFPAVMFPDLPPETPLRGGYNRRTHTLLMQLAWRLFKDAINSSRREILDMPPMKKSFRELMSDPYPVTYGFSRHVIPPPPDWGSHVRISGYWFLDAPTWQPPPDLIEFLNAGAPPVYIGFGSMSNRDPDAMTELVVKAVTQSGQRGLLLTGWGGIKTASLPDTMFAIDSAPHDWLFPRMAAVVHHGGAGTTAAGLRAGIPSILVPHFADQSYWGQRVYDLGVGPTPIQRKRLTPDALAAAIRQAVTNPDMRCRASELALNIQAEDGTANTVRIVEDAIQR